MTNWRLLAVALGCSVQFLYARCFALYSSFGLRSNFGLRIDWAGSDFFHQGTSVAQTILNVRFFGHSRGALPEPLPPHNPPPLRMDPPPPPTHHTPVTTPAAPPTPHQHRRQQWWNALTHATTIEGSPGQQRTAQKRRPGHRGPWVMSQQTIYRGGGGRPRTPPSLQLRGRVRRGTSPGPEPLD